MPHASTERDPRCRRYACAAVVYRGGTRFFHVVLAGFVLTLAAYHSTAREPTPR
jgi:hypothetical protein